MGKRIAGRRAISGQQNAIHSVLILDFCHIIRVGSFTLLFSTLYALFNFVIETFEKMKQMSKLGTNPSLFISFLRVDVVVVIIVVVIQQYF